MMTTKRNSDFFTLINEWSL